MRRLDILELGSTRPVKSLRVVPSPGVRATAYLLKGFVNTTENYSRAVGVIREHGGRVVMIRPSSVFEEKIDMMIYAEVPDEMEERVAEGMEGAGICDEVIIVETGFRNMLINILFPYMVGGYRAVVVTWPAYSGLMKRLRSRLGEEAARTFLYHIGYEIGVETAKTFSEVRGESPAESMKRFLLIMRSLGYACLRRFEEHDGEISFELNDNWEAKVLGQGYTVPQCYLSRGVFEGFIEALTGDEWRVEEVRCVAKGDEACGFKLVKA